MSDINKESIRKWIEALRGGEYEQGYHHLRNKDETYCCLGVACDLFKDRVRGKWEDKFESHYSFDLPPDQKDFGYGNEYMPDSVVEYLGLSEEFLNDELTTMNDNGHSFEEIANTIENKLEEYK